jgi:twitching motility protein PilT
MAINISDLLRLMVQKGISDIHFKADSVPAFRLHGSMILAANLQKLSADDVAGIAKQLMTPEQAKVFEQEQELDMAFTMDGVSRFRLNVFRQRSTFEELNLPVEPLKKLAAETRGLILFAGITGAGKTTTLNHFVHHLNSNNAYRIITIEDPIEFYHSDIKSTIAQREVGYDTRSFASALRHILRQDPDVVVIGEMRDLETMQAAIAAAETGHLVLSTVHTMDAVQTVTRIVDAYPAHMHDAVRMQLANCLKGIVGQRLVISKDGKRRFPAVEILVNNSAVRQNLLDGKLNEVYKTLEKGAYYGMQTFDQDLVRLVKEGKIDAKAAADASTTPQDLAIKLQNMGSETGAEGAPAAV